MASPISAVQKAPLILGICGCGVVGQGLLAILEAARIKSIRIKKVLIKNPHKHVETRLPVDATFVYNANDILEDPEINCIIELIGGTEIAKDIIYTALKKSKHVITGNKALIASSLDALQVLWDKTEGKSGFFYETAVCGGIPVVNAIKRGLAMDSISRVAGIMNGTSNFMLTKMTQENLTFEEALMEAQKLGYAEVDPSADVEGWDAQHKLCILSKLAFGVTMDASLFCQGICALKPCDFQFAKSQGYTIKLMGMATRKKLDNLPSSSFSVEAFLSPSFVPLKTSFAAIEGVTNAVELTSFNLGTSFFSGPGAGSLPSANSAASDLFELHSQIIQAKEVKFSSPFPKNTTDCVFTRNFISSFYFRFHLAKVSIPMHLLTQLFQDFCIPLCSLTLVEDKHYKTKGCTVAVLSKPCAFILVESLRNAIQIKKFKEEVLCVESFLFLPLFLID